jgi:cysteinyl-tRNA synthetase
MGLRLYNTLGRRLMDFEPIVPGKVSFYGCGPTVYNYAHIGNLRAYVLHDLLVRSLRWLGYEVAHVMNITDVGHLASDADSGEDRMLKTARETGKGVLEIAKFYTEAFFRDMELLNIGRPSVVCKATEHIADMIELIKRIEERGFTYFAGGNLYFDVSKSEGYGELALLDRAELKAGARVDVDPNKRHPHDFVLWFTKSKFENHALAWDSPWGRGYPGWHIECSAMSMRYLGDEIDIHAGGIDHIPVHHTNEIAQSEAATGKRWVRYWIHNEFLLMGKAKMAKSAGNFITLSTLMEEGYEPMDYRYFLLGAHYGAQLAFSKEALDGARSSRRSLMKALARLRGLDPSELPPREAIEGRARGILEAFKERIEDNLSSPRALAELWALARDESIEARQAAAAAREMDSVLGLRLLEPEAAAARPDAELAARVEALIEERAKAKRERNFVRADEIRDALKAEGIVLEDGPAGTTWRPA